MLNKHVLNALLDLTHYYDSRLLNGNECTPIVGEDFLNIVYPLLEVVRYLWQKQIRTKSRFVGFAMFYNRLFLVKSKELCESEYKTNFLYPLFLVGAFDESLVKLFKFWNLKVTYGPVI